MHHSGHIPAEDEEGARMNGGPQYRIGLRVRSPLYSSGEVDISHVLDRARSKGFFFILGDGVLREEHIQGILAGTIEPEDSVRNQFAVCDSQLKSTWRWYTGVSTFLSDVTKELTGGDLQLRRRASRLLEEEVDTASHLCLKAVVLDLTEVKDGSEVLDLAHVLHSALIKPHIAWSEWPLKLWVKLPIAFPHEVEDDDGEQTKESAWNLWHTFRRFCDFHENVGLLLDLGLESLVQPQSPILLRWLGEPVAAVLLPQNSFVPIRSPVDWEDSVPEFLSPSQGFIVNLFMTAGVDVVVDPVGSTEKRLVGAAKNVVLCAERADYEPVFRFRGKLYPTSFADVLQHPLKLKSHTTDMLEKDTIKYLLFKQAVCRALEDLVPEEEHDQRIVVLVVLGAERGPIVDSVVEATKSSGLRVKIYVVERNRHAVNALFYTEWEDNVNLVHADSRKWTPEEGKVDMIISDLLGSFGDDLLSPEILDGAQRLLKEDGVMIPQSYANFVTPVMFPKLLQESSRLHLDVHDEEDAQCDMPYVVNLYQRYQISEPKELFSFSHPRQDPSKPNERFGKLAFQPKLDSMLNGFAGYFDCTLYKDVKLSILPANFSQNLISWYPMFFPLRTPITVGIKDEIEVLFWRRVSSCKKRVWYEWGLSSPQILAPHNTNGRAYSVDLES